MTITLEPQQELELHHKAAEQGQKSEEYVKRLIAEALHSRLPLPLPPTLLSTEEFVKEWREWTSSHRPRSTRIPDEALRREIMYDNEDH